MCAQDFVKETTVLKQHITHKNIFVFKIDRFDTIISNKNKIEVG